MRRRVTLRAAVTVLFLVMLGTTVSAAPQPGVLHFTTVGDFGQTTNTTAVLNQLAATGSDVTMTLGDLSYGAVGAEQSWCDFVKARVGPSFPFELLSGNHESNGRNGNINDFSACLPNQVPGLVGTYGRQYYLDMPAVDPLVRFVMISPGLTYPDGVWSYAAGTARYQWTAQAIDGARAAGVPWVVVGMHQPCLTVGQYACGSGADLFNMLLSKKVDLVLSGHEHNYQRSHQVSLGAGCAAVVPGRYDAGCVVDRDRDFRAGAGSVALVVGTGGQGLYDINTADPELPYFGSTSGLNANPTHGLLDVQATTDVLRASFVRGAGGSHADSFTLTRSATEPNQPPVASFTSRCTGLTCTFDASTSADPDGPLVGYAWDFGDGQSAAGVTSSHAYSGAGSYPVKLRVTDGAGATGEVTRAVTVTTAPSSLVVDDQFSRTTTASLGSATVGGPWTVRSPVENYAVANGFAHLKVAAGATLNASLNQAVTTQSDLRLSFGLDKVPTGNGLYLSVHGRRVTSSSGYFARVGVASSGSVSLALARAVSGVKADLQPQVTVPGLVFAPGDLLNLRTEVTGTAPTTVRAKVWKVGTPEPATWLRSATDSTPELQNAGGVAVGPYLSSAAINAPITVRLDSLVVTGP